MAWQLYAPTQVGTMTMVNVKDYGAIGNGVANDTVAIQTAINAAGAMGVSSRGVDVFFPAGIYVLGTATPITVPFNNVMLVGAGWQSTVLFYSAGTTGDVLQIGNGTSKSGCGVKDMSIWKSAAATAGNQININAMNDCLIRDVVINNYFVGVLVGSAAAPSLKVWLDHVEFNNGTVTTGVGLQITNGAGGDTYITDCVMSNAPANKPAVGIQISQAGHVSIIRCNVTSFIKGLHVNPVTSQDVSYLFIDHTLFDSCGSHGAHFNGTTAASSRIRSVVCVDSWFAGTTTAGGFGIELTAASGSIVDDISFIGCRILNNQQHGVVMNAGPTNISITDCTLAGNGAQTVNTYDGISVVANAAGLAVMDCKIGTAGTAGNQQRYAINIAAGTSSNISIIGNDCQTNGTVGNRGYINVGAITGGGNIIENNTPGVPDGFGSSRVAATAAITTTDTLVSDVTAQRNRLFTNALVAGTTLRVTIRGTYTVTTAAGTWNCFIRMGTGNVVADAAILSLGAQTTGATPAGPNAFEIMGDVTVRTLTTCYGYFKILENIVGASGLGLIATKQASLIVGTAAGITATQANYVNASMIGSANCSITVQTCTIEAVVP